LVFGNWFSPNKLNNLNIRKNQTKIFKLRNIYEWDTDKIVYKRDEWGFRGEYPDLNSIDILTIGGSTTDQRYISEGYTFQDVLHKEFKKNGEDIFVVNAGIDGHSTVGHIKNFDWWFPKIPNLNVKYFLFYVGVNDFHKDPYDIYQELSKKSTNSIRYAIKSNSAIH